MHKALLGFLLATAYAASAVPINSEYSDDGLDVQFDDFSENDDIIMAPIDLEAELDQEVLDEVEKDVNNYLLYTRRNPETAQVLKDDDKNSIKKSYFKYRQPTVVIAHSWLGGENTDLNSVIRDAFLAKDEVNVIVLDWRRLALSNYVTAARGVPQVGRNLGKFLAFLSKTSGQKLNKVHLVGFGLGAHLVGNAGRFLDGKVARITALDPAGPLFNINSNRLNPNDAIYVEVLNTDGDTLEGLGLGSDVGNANFYVNGGTSQPGCFTSICNHNRSWRLFAASVTYDHLSGNLCSNSVQVLLNRCRGDQLALGNGDLNKSVEGVKKYRANTRRRYPY